MDNSKVFVLLLAFVSLASAASKNIIQPRIFDGEQIDTLSRFPHHVTIEPIYDMYGPEGPKICSGSIIEANFVLTSITCVRNSTQLKIHIQRLYFDNSTGSYTLILNNDPSTVFLYPTKYDDIALVKFPVDLKFNKYLKPIEISRTPINILQNKLVVTTGFDNSLVQPGFVITYQLTYAMLKIVDNTLCKNAYSSEDFDEYLEMCVVSWSNSTNVPCFTDQGSGLVAGWPASPELVGVYSGSSIDCDYKIPMIYTNVQKYKPWIKSIIADN